MIPDVHFNNPHVLWLLLLVPAVLWLSRRRVTTSAVRYPSVRHLKRLPRSFRQRCRSVLPALRGSALVLLVLVLARPTRSLETQELPSQGIGIAMVVDRSYSMIDPDGKLMYDGGLQLRFEIAKRVFREFVQGNGQDLKGRPNDLIGLFSFATYPRTDHPFSLDHTSLLNVVERMSAEKPFVDKLGRATDDPREAARETDEHGRVITDAFGRTFPKSNPMQFTDIKKALEYVADKLSLLNDDLARSSAGVQAYDMKSKVLVLLTDGEPTISGDPRDANYADEPTIKRLTEAGIKVYFVQILSQQRYRERPDGTIELILNRSGPRANELNRMANEIINAARRLARRTGGQHFLATSGDQLKEVYAEIDKLERSDVGGRTILSQQESYGKPLSGALGLLALETVLGLTYLRRSP